MNRYKVLITILSFFCSLLPALLYSQVDTAWVRRYNGPGGPGNDNDWAFSLVVDGQGNVYVTGTSTGSGTSYDYATIKYNSLGVEQWVARYNGPGNNQDEASAIAVDDQGNVYVTGESYGSGTGTDYATIKYNSNGDTIWLRRYNGPGNSYDDAYAIAVDSAGNIYVTGQSYGSGTSYDYATIKYNSNGDTLWVRRYNGPGNNYDYVRSLAVDGSGNVFVTGYGAGSGTSDDYATIKYNSNGVEQWVQRYNGPGNDVDWTCSLAVDGQGNVYVTGESYELGTYEDYATIKYVQTQGIEEIEIATPSARNDFVVYPNPAKAYFTIRLPQSANQAEIKIFDVTGKEVKEFKFDVASAPSTLRVTLDGIKNGVYFVKVGDEMVKEKLVITK